ncbi:MAG: hypothetical protein AB7Q00_14400 [Phycisphaerales bacterium]
MRATQPWLDNLSVMQQSVLLTAIRGPDGIRKDHVAKLLLRWYRRSILVLAFEQTVVTNPCSLGGGSFTGPSVSLDHALYWKPAMDEVVTEYLRHVDELPHHFQLHLMHAAEIVGYKHPDPNIRAWWHHTYLRLVNDMHLYPELEEHMDLRLGDNERGWRDREEVTAANPRPDGFPHSSSCNCDECTGGTTS